MHEILGPPPPQYLVADPSVAPHAVAPGGLLEPDDGGFPRLRIAVIGGESCGTRMMAKLLAKAGCEVLHRSFPYEGSHLRHWPDEPVRNYQPDAIVVMQRDWWAATQSQVREGHVPDADTAFGNLAEAACRIAALVRGEPWRAVNYESLVAHPQVVFDNLCDWLHIPSVAVGEVFDANQRYFGVRPPSAISS